MKSQQIIGYNFSGGKNITVIKNTHTDNSVTYTEIVYDTETELEYTRESDREPYHNGMAGEVVYI